MTGEQSRLLKIGDRVCCSNRTQVAIWALEHGDILRASELPPSNGNTREKLIFPQNSDRGWVLCVSR